MKADGLKAQCEFPKPGGKTKTMTFKLPDGCDPETEARRITLAYGVDVRVLDSNGDVVLTVLHEGP